MRVIVTTEAEAYLNGIAAYLDQESPLLADRILTHLQHCIAGLKEAALHYQVVITRGDRAIRRRVEPPYNIFYWIDAEIVWVVHVLHGARNFETASFPDED